MAHAHLTASSRDVIAAVPRRLFGSFVEHMGRAVYTGIYEPGHPTADEHGFRGDVLDLVGELGATIVRYPGGNFVSGYNWEDGIGPVADRPTRLNESWKSIETNEVGLHEFMQWASTAGVEVMYAVNLGTRGLDAARAVLEYANFPGGTTLSDQRRANGAEHPFGITVWGLGNEVDGEHQIGHKTAEEYARLATETARVMKMIDPTIELVAAGSSNYDMPTFGSWERTVLEHSYDLVDYISVHAYFEQDGADVTSFLASSVALDRHIDEVIAVADEVQAARGSSKQMMIAVDEWNVWYQNQFTTEDEPERFAREGWQKAPRLIEDSYGVADAVVLGGLLNSLLRHADRVTLANLAQLVNVIAPIRTEPNGPAWRQSTFFPFASAARFARGSILRLTSTSSQVPTPRFGDVDALDAVATFDAEADELVFFLVNRSVAEDCAATISVDGFVDLTLIAAHTLGGDPHGTGNTLENPTHVGLVPLTAFVEADTALTVTLPPASWSMVRLKATASHPSQ